METHLWEKPEDTVRTYCYLILEGREVHSPKAGTVAHDKTASALVNVAESSQSIPVTRSYTEKMTACEWISDLYSRAIVLPGPE